MNCGLKRTSFLSLRAGFFHFDVFDRILERMFHIKSNARDARLANGKRPLFSKCLDSGVNGELSFFRP